MLCERFTNVSDAVAVDDVDDELFDDFEVCVSDRTARVKDKEEVDTVALRTSGLQLFTHAYELGSVATRSVVLLPEVALTFDVTRNVNVLRLKQIPYMFYNFLLQKFNFFIFLLTLSEM